MIRPAKFADVPAMVGIMEARYQVSLYAKLGAMDVPAAKRLLVGSVQRHGGTGEGATLVMVAEGLAGVTGFIVGLLDRVYHVGVPLTCTDLFFTSQPGANDFDPVGLLGSVVAWGEANPRVVELKMGVVDTFGTDLDRADVLYRRFNLERCGAIYRRSIER